MGRHFSMAPESRFFCNNCGKEGIPVKKKKGQD